jgi:hypothetical protein
MEASGTCRLPAESASAARRGGNRDRFRKIVDARSNGRESTRSAADGPQNISNFLRLITISKGLYRLQKSTAGATVRSGSGGRTHALFSRKFCPRGRFYSTPHAIKYKAPGRKRWKLVEVEAGSGR